MFSDNVPTVSQTFSVAVSFSQEAGSSGYLFAKHSDASPRLYSAFLSSGNTDSDPHELVFLYTAVGAVAGEGVTATARFPLASESSLSDGAPHQLILTVGGGGVTVRIDGSQPVSQRLLGQAVKDCTASTTPSCTLAVGAATGDSFRFVGTVFGAWLFPGTALSAFPEMLLSGTPIGVPQLVTPPTRPPGSTAAAGTTSIAATTSAAATTAPAATTSNAAGAAETSAPDQSDEDDDTVAVVQQCTPGSYQTAAGRCIFCPAGQTDHDVDPTSPCTKCPSGGFVPKGSAGTCDVVRTPCAEGTTDHDSSAATECYACPPGTHTLAEVRGSCNLHFCKFGFTDHDSDPSTPCTSCAGLHGIFAPPGSSGPCASLNCAPGSIDADSDGATPCVTCNGATEYQDISGQGECKLVSFCNVGEEQAQPPTKRSDRVCAACELGITFSNDPFDEAGCRPVTPPCDNGTSVEAVSATPSSDRVCELTTTTTTSATATTTTTTTNHRICTISLQSGTGFYESEAPTSTSDRVCLPLTECDGATKFETAAPVLAQSNYPDEAGQPVHAISNRECALLTVCAAGDEFESTPPQHNADRVCSVLRAPCFADTEYEAVTPNATTDRVCDRVAARCRVGEFERLAPTLTSNRMCELCGAGSIDDDRDPLTPCVFCQGGTYQNSEGATACIDSTLVCPVGTEEVQDTTRSSARICRQCNGVTEYQDLAGQTACKSVSECGPGTFVATEQTAAADRSCTPCDGVTEYQDKGMQPFCMPMSGVCGYGFYESARGTPQSDRTCTACEVGVTYQDQLNQSGCFPVTSCAAGSATFRAPTPGSDRICVACDGTLTYQDEDGADECKTVTTCDATSQFVAVSATASSDAQCATLNECTAGEFQDGFEASGDRRCTAHQTCTWPDQYEFQAPTLTSNRICAPTTTCRENHFEVIDESVGVEEDEGSGNSNAELFAAVAKDRVCEKCTRCSSYGEYESVACGATHDTECAACNSCTAGETYQTVACSRSGDTVCTACTACSGSIVSTSFGEIYVGMFAAKVCSTDQDTVCQACSQCQEGEFEAARCSGAADTVCKPKCGYLPGSGGTLLWNGDLFTSTNDSCRTPTVCGEEEWEAIAPSPDTDRVCKQWTECDQVPDVIVAEATDAGNAEETSAVGEEAGEVVGDGDTSEVLPTGSFEVVSPTRTSDRQCKKVAECTRDEFQSIRPTLFSDRTCSTLTACADAEYVTVAATLTTDRVCTEKPLCTTDEEINVSYEADGLVVTWSCIQRAEVTALQAQRTAAIGKSSGLVVGAVVIFLLIGFLAVRNKTSGTFVDFGRKGVDDPDYFDIDPVLAKQFWFRFEKRIEMIPGRRIRPISALKAEAAKVLQEEVLEKLDEDEDASSSDSDDNENEDQLLAAAAVAELEAEARVQTPVEEVATPTAVLPNGTTPDMLSERLRQVQAQLAELSSPAPMSPPMSPMATTNAGMFATPGLPLQLPTMGGAGNQSLPPFLHLGDVTVTSSEIDEDIDTRL